MSEQKQPYDPFEHLTTGDDFIEALKPENWTETIKLHTPSLEATLLDGGRVELMLLFPDGYHITTLKRSDVEALTRFLDQYAGVEPLPASTDPFETFQPTRVEEVESEEPMSEQIDQARALTLIEQAIRELDGEYEATPVQVQAWLKERHNVDLPIEQVSGNMKIVRETIDGEEE